MFKTTTTYVSSCGLISSCNVEDIRRGKSKITVGGVLNKITVRENGKRSKIIIKDGLLNNKKKEGISMNKNLVKILVAGAAVVGAVVIAKKVKARKARKAEEVKDENINEEVEEEETEEEVTEEDFEVEVEEDEEDEEDETDDEDDDEVPVIVEKVVVRIAHYVGIGIGILLGRLLLKDTIRLEEAMKKL